MRGIEPIPAKLCTAVVDKLMAAAMPQKKTRDDGGPDEKSTATCENMPKPQTIVCGTSANGQQNCHHGTSRTGLPVFLWLRTCIRMFVKFSYFCQLFSSYERFSANELHSDTWSPARHIGRGLGAIRTLWSAWQALKVFFSRREWITISLVSIRDAFFCTYLWNVVIFLVLHVLVLIVPTGTFFCVWTQHTTQATDNPIQQQSRERG